LPGSICHKQVAGAPHRATATLVVAVVGDEELTGRRERQPEWIAQSPSHELHAAATVESHPQDRTAARDLAFDHLAGFRFGAERNEATRFRASFVLRERIVGFVIDAGQRHIRARDVVKIGMPRQPTERRIVFADDA
jgi:hypothetical protein